MARSRRTLRAWRSLSLSALTAACLLTGLLASAQAAPRPARANAASIEALVPRALRVAAALSTRADHALVAHAKKLDSCLRASSHDPSRCRGMRRAVQRAGRALARERQRLAWAARASTRAHNASATAARRAPYLSVSGDRLTWTTPARIDTFVLVRRISGQRDEYSVLHGTSSSPPPMPGLSVGYRVRTAVSGSSWSSWRHVSYPASGGSSPRAPSEPSGSTTGEAADPQAAPELTVSGQTLSWNAVAGVSAYVLVSKLPGHSETFTVVNGTSTTPAPTPGVTVHYSVRTAVNGSEWAPEVAISYPAPPTPPKEAPTTPQESPATSADPSFDPGVDAGWDIPEEPDAAASIGAKVIRLELLPRESPAEIEKFIRGYAEKGVRVAPLAGFEGTMPSPAEAQNLASWAKAYGPGGTFWANRSDGYLAIQTIEFGNETDGGWQYGDEQGDASYTARAETYAVRLKEASEAISATGMHVGLLAVAEDPTGDWMDGMFAAVPNLGSYVGGWVSHLYGPGWRAKLEGVISQSAAHGASSTIPIAVTEWGISSENETCVLEDYGWNPCMNYQEAAETLRKNIGEVRQMLGSRLSLFIFYQLRDQRPVNATQSQFYYFGLLQQDMQPKGAYTTAAEEILAE